ncbi:hypothetical protein [Azohydromonas aeria]|uniref:hypothetical protein n=1 Tax=Azohydromonas aeria TaxID=2590212 RepID=UPI0012F8CD1A|nr:hypothetical protein [Azohydromonas aeria]
MTHEVLGKMIILPQKVFIQEIISLLQYDKAWDGAMVTENASDLGKPGLSPSPWTPKTADADRARPMPRSTLRTALPS